MAKKKVKKVGLDGGNGNAKFSFEGSERLLIPTVEGLLLKEKTSFQSKEEVTPDNIHQHLDITYVSSQALEKTNRRFLIGEKALRDQDVVESETDTRAKKEEEEIIVRVALAGLLVDAIRNNPDKKSITANYDLQLALPIVGATLEGYTKHATRFIGTHALKYHYPNGETIDVTIVIEFAYTLPEGAVGAYAIVYDLNAHLQEYQYVDEEETKHNVTLENRDILVCDIGANSLDVAPLKGVILDNQNIKGYNLGTKETIERLRDDWNEKYEQDQLESLADFNRLFSSKNNAVSNRLVEFSELYLEVGASKIADVLKTRIRKMSSETLIFVFGGGSILYKSTLIKKLKQYQNKLFFVDNPIFTNADGLLIFAQTPTYEHLKQEHLKAVDQIVKA